MQKRFEALGFIWNKYLRRRMVVMRCLCCGQQFETTWEDYESGKYD